MDPKNSVESGAESEELKEETVNIGNFTRGGFKILMESIRHANALPQDDFNYYNIQEPFKKIMNNESNRVLSLMNTILRKNGIKSNMKTSVLEHQTELLIEANDIILERVADNIDEMNGIKKSTINLTEFQRLDSQRIVNGSWNRITDINSHSSPSISLARTDNSKSHKDLLLLNSVTKPQTFFKDKIDNSSLCPWEPRIKDKPNSLKPLAIFLELTERGEEFSQPYEFELDRFVPQDEQLLPDENKPVFPKTLQETKFVQVDNPNQLTDLVEDLRKYKVIGVDLEHHSYRSFMGITCLMQISTGDTDYIIDTIKLREELCILNEIFTKPNIVKIFHGADSDILWLQRDLSLYVVNMFDTYQAAKLLEYSSLSLAYLLERFCGFKPNKHFQLADWRIRPLSNALLDYAREDTHYLIYIYGMLKNELLKKAGMTDKLLRTVYSRSAEICKKRYFKQRWTEESHLDFYQRCKRMFDNRQLYALKELYKWRDNIAREEDESTGYVLPNHMLLQIAESLPREMQGVLACCNPIPPLVRSNLLELHHIIIKARERPLQKSILQEDARAKGSTIKLSKVNIDSPLHCPHDLSQNKDYNDNLPTLLDSEKEDDSTKAMDLEKPTSTYSIFQYEKKVTAKPLKKFRFLAPFERYQLVKMFIQDEEKKLAAEEETVQNVPTEDIKPDLAQIHNKTNEEQIKEYFKKLTKKTVQDEELAKKREEQLYQKVIKAEKEKSLIEMGGNKKRKRIDSSNSTVDNNDHSNKQNWANNSNNRTENLPLNRKQNKKKFKKNKNKNHNPEPKNAIKKENSNNSVTVEKSGQKSNRKRKREDANFEAFDYTSVDYRQFQGGASTVNQGKNIKSKFKNKGKGPNVNKASNKSGMFRKSGKKR